MFRQSADMEARTPGTRLMVHVFFLLCAHVQDVVVSGSVTLRPEPNRQQFFVNESLTLHCQSSYSSAGWRFMHQTKGELISCKNETTVCTTRSSCRVENVYPGDSGVYWCESGGQRSNNIDIIVTAGQVILEIPVLPVMEGDDITLHCRDKTTSNLPADFYKDGIRFGSSSSGVWTINNISKINKGIYQCKTSGGESAYSWINVRDPPALLSLSTLAPTSGVAESQTERHQETPPSLDVLSIILRNLVPGVMMALLLLLLGLLHCWKLRVHDIERQNIHSDTEV